ncbi:hypothetical protein DZA50_04820 [Kangiella sp. HD9-110m-PIT-SAG07]|nr:hypothetical protein DZA50_04820 [Kangiella sp. HD9-110m-PIT-SAG07]
MPLMKITIDKPLSDTSLLRLNQAKLHRFRSNKVSFNKLGLNKESLVMKYRDKKSLNRFNANQQEVTL